jgi:oligoribonuclease
MSKNDRLVWMDLEMTGLEPATDKILEIATVVTDSDLNIIEHGPELVIHQPDSVLSNMNDWCKEHHGNSGLTEKVKVAGVTEPEAEFVTLSFVKEYVEEFQAPLCGNSIHQDRNFLVRHMPDLNAYLHYRNIDVSSLKELSFRWYPDMQKFVKANKHTAMEDILESIEELKYYRKMIFK